MANDVKLKLAVEGGQAVTAVIDGVNKKLTEFEKSADIASMGVKALTSAMGGFSAAMTIGKLVSVQREFDVLNSSLITVTGSSAAAAREMQWIKGFAKETPFGLAQATQGFVKMKALGLDPTKASLTSFGNTASAMGKDLNQMVEAVADASTGEFERLKEFGIKASKEGDQVALTFQGVTTTIGNNSKEITGYLEALGANEFAGAMAERAKTLDGAIAGLSDTWDELFRTVNTNNTGGLIYDSITLATKAIEDATTILNSMSAASATAAQSTGALATIQSGIATIFETVAVLGANVKYVLVGIGRELGGLAAQSAQILQGNFSGAASIRQSMIADGQAARRDIDATSSRILSARKDAAAASEINAAANARLAHQGVVTATATTAHTAATKANGSAAKAAAKELETQADTLAKLSGYNKDYEDQANRLVKMKEKSTLTEEGYLRAINELVAAQPAMVASIKAEKDAQESLQKVYATIAKDREKYTESLTTGLEKLTADTQAQQDNIDRMGLSKTAIAELDAAHLRLQATRLDGLAIDQLVQYQDSAAYATMQAQAAQLRQQADNTIAKAQKETSADAAKDMAAEQKKAAEESSKYWEDALMRAFESGKGFFESLWDTIKNTLKTQVLKVAISAVGLGGAGASSAAQGLGSIGGIGNALGGLSTMSGIYNAATVGYGSMMGSAATALLGQTAGNAAIATAVTGSASMSTAAAAAAAEAAGASAAAAGSAASMGASFAAAVPYVAAALAAAAVLKNLGVFGSNFISAENSGDSARSYDQSGQLVSSLSLAVKNSTADGIVDGMQKSYKNLADTLGISMSAVSFGYGSNTGEEGKNPNVITWSQVGSAAFDPAKNAYNSGETAAANLSLVASRAVLAALQQSSLPKYLASIFDSITASTATQEQIDATIAYATGIKGVRDALLETREPLQIVKDSAAAAFATLATSAETFKTDFVAAIDAGIGPDQLIQWQALGTALDTLAQDDAAKVKVALDAATEALKKQTEWQTKLDIATGATTQREVEKTTALAAADDATDLLINQLYAFEDAAAAASAAAELALRKTALTDKYTPMTLDGAKAALPAGLADQFVSMGSAAAKTLVSSYVATLTDPAAIAQVEGLGQAIDVLFASMADSEAVTKSLSDASRQLAIDLMTAQGNTEGASEATRALATEGMTALQISMWDANEATKALIASAAKPIIEPMQQLSTAADSAADSVRQLGYGLDGMADKFSRRLSLMLNFDDSLASTRNSLRIQTGANNNSAQSYSSIPEYITKAFADLVTDTATINNDRVSGLNPNNVDANGSQIGYHQFKINTATVDAMSRTATVIVGKFVDWFDYLGTETQTLEKAIIAAGNSAVGQTLQTGEIAQYFTDLGKEITDAATAITEFRTDVATVVNGLIGADTVLSQFGPLNAGTDYMALAGSLGGASAKIATAIAQSIFDKVPDAVKKDPAMAGVGIQIMSIIGSVTEGDLQGLNDSFLLLSGSLARGELTSDQYTKAIDYLTKAFQSGTGSANSVAKAYERALLEAAGNTSGLAKFDLAVSSAALIADGWTKEQVDAVQKVKNRKALEDLRDEAMQRYIDTQEKVLDAQKAYASALKSTISSMKDFLASLDGSSTATSVTAARANFTGLADKAAAGDTSVYDKLQPAAKSFLELSKTYSRSLQEYRRDEAVVRASINGVIKVTEAQLAKLPSEMALDTDPIREAWTALQIATNEQTNASVLLTAMSVDQGASRARLTAAEDTLAARYLDAISSSPDFSKLKEKFDTAIVDLVNANALPDYSAVFALPPDVTLETIIDNKIPEVTWDTFVLPAGVTIESLLDGYISGVFPDNFTLPAGVTIESLLSGYIAAGVFPDTFTLPEGITVESLLKRQIDAALPEAFVLKNTTIEQLLKGGVDRVLPYPLTLPNGVTMEMLLNTQIDEALPRNLAGMQYDLAGALITRVNRDILPNEFVGKKFDLQAMIDTLLTSRILQPGMAGLGFNLERMTKDSLDQVLPERFAGSKFNLSDKIDTRILQIMPDKFAGEKFNAALMMQTAINNAMAGVGTAATPNHGTTGTAYGVTKLPGYAVGSNYIPNDGPAYLHAGEEITPRPFVDMQREAREETNALLASIKAELASVKAELAAIKGHAGNTATNTSKTSRTLEAVTLGGTELRTKAIP